MKNAWLAQTKFVPPRLRDDIVLRSRLVDSLRVAVISRPLTLLSVPAGYGKMTLPALLTDISLAWVSMYRMILLRHLWVTSGTWNISSNQH